MKTEKPTRKQIATEIETLREMKPRVRHFSAFDDDHHAAIEAQIQVMEDNIELDSIENRREMEWPDNVTDAAMEARYWMDGDEPKAPSENWKELEIK